MSGDPEADAILLKASAKLDVKDKLDNTPLHLAADRNQTEAVQLLLDVGAPVDPDNKNGMTPLMIAAKRGNIDLKRAPWRAEQNVGDVPRTAIWITAAEQLNSTLSRRFLAERSTGATTAVQCFAGFDPVGWRPAIAVAGERQHPSHLASNKASISRGQVLRRWRHSLRLSAAALA